MRSHAVSLVAVLGVGILGHAFSAAAQTPPHQPGPLDQALNGNRSVAGFKTVGALSGEWQVVDFFALPNRDVRLPNGTPWIEYVARRQSGVEGSEGVVSWTTSRDCPALYNTMVWMSALVPPRIEIPGVGPSEAEPAGRRPITMMADGLITTVWGRGSQPDHTLNARTEMSSNGGLIAQFGRAATENLAPCWSFELPAMALPDTDG